MITCDVVRRGGRVELHFGPADKLRGLGLQIAKALKEVADDMAGDLIDHNWDVNGEKPLAVHLHPGGESYAEVLKTMLEHICRDAGL